LEQIEQMGNCLRMQRKNVLGRDHNVPVQGNSFKEENVLKRQCCMLIRKNVGTELF